MTVQIAVKLDESVLAGIDELVEAGSFESRSAAVRQALAALLAAERRAGIDRAYAQGYGRVPETEYDMADAARLAIEAIHDEPWERWW